MSTNAKSPTRMTRSRPRCSRKRAMPYLCATAGFEEWDADMDWAHGHNAVVAVIPGTASFPFLLSCSPPALPTDHLNQQPPGPDREFARGHPVGKPPGD